MTTRCPSAGLTQTRSKTGHDWPGNVRELHNAGPRRDPEEGGLITPNICSCGGGVARRAPVVDVERRTIEEVLRDSDRNKSKAARRLGITHAKRYRVCAA